MSVVRTRFAPSPTGDLHIGGARTALFNYLFTRRHGGSFILRIDDTDRERSTTEALQGIHDALRWLGLSWDEGPYFQSQRLSLYQEKALELLRAGRAYRCYCAPGALEAKRQAALAAGRKPAYDRTCRGKKEAGAGPYAIRFKAPQEGETAIADTIKGAVVFHNDELDDLIIFRSDATPTYNFSSVVDDAELGITHIIRGDDHLANTPRQILLFQALGVSLPRFAHLPLILGQDKAPLSKRHGAVSVLAYKENGYLPDALVNYLARLGWSYGDQEIFTRDELIARFSLEDVGKSAGIFNPEKLLWLNFHYLKALPVPQLAKEIKPFVAQKGYRLPDDDLWLEKMVSTLRERAKTLKELVEFAHFYLDDNIHIDEKIAQKFLGPEILPAFLQLRDRLQGLEDWTHETIKSVFQTVMDDLGLPLGKIAQPVRVALTGGTVSPGIFEVIDVLGKPRTLARLNRIITRMEAGSDDFSDSQRFSP